MAFIKQSQAYTRSFKMIDSTDHFSKKTGLTCTVNLSKAGGAFGVAGGSVVEVAQGWYVVNLNTTDTNTLGDLLYYITAAGADDTDFSDQVVVSNLNDTIPVNVVQFVGGTAGVGGAGRPFVFVVGGTCGSVTGAVGSVTGAVGSVTGSVNSVTTGVTVTTNNDKTGYFVVGGTTGVVGSVTGAVGSVTSGVTVSTNNDKTGYFVVGGTTGVVTNYVQAVAGGTVGRVTVTVASLTANADKTGYSLVDPQTFSLTGNITGNVSGSVGSVTGAVGSVTTPVFVQGGTVGKVTGAVTIASNQLFVKKNTALANFMFPMIDSTDHVTLKTGLTVTGEVSIDGGAFGALTNSPSELSSGVYKVDLAAGDVNGTNIMLKFTSAGADTRLIEFITQT